MPATDALLTGTLFRPAAGGAVAGVVLVAGSGDGKRDSLRGMAEGLAARGIAVLTYDKRLDGYSVFRRDYPALGRDASAAVAFLRIRAGTGRVGVWGISEGGWVITAAAASDPRIAFVVMVSAPVVPPGQQIGWLASGFLRRHGLGLLEHYVALQLRLGPRYADYEPPLYAVRQPVLAVFGAHDATIPVATAVRTLQRDLPSAPAIVVHPGAGHAMTTADGSFPAGHLDRVAGWIHRPHTVIDVGSPVAQGLDVPEPPAMPLPTAVLLLSPIALFLGRMGVLLWTRMAPSSRRTPRPRPRP